MEDTPRVAGYYDKLTFWYRHFYSAIGMHYGFWSQSTRNQHEAMLNHKALLFRKLGQLTPASHVLDAGCGYGATALHFCRLGAPRVTGISVSGAQIRAAARAAEKAGLAQRTDFHIDDFCQSRLGDAVFSHAFASESSCHATDKKRFLAEMFRLLQPGGGDW